MDRPPQPTGDTLAERLRLTDPRLMFAIAADRRDVVTSLWALDARLDAQLAATREPALAQIRLRWWQDELAKLDMAETLRPPPADPLLGALSADPCGPADLVALADLWEAILLSDVADPAQLADLAAQRGQLLFAATRRRAGGPADVDVCQGINWGLVDLALHPAYAEAAAGLLAAARARPHSGPRGNSLALLDHWAARVAARGGRTTPLRDAAWLFMRGLRLGALPNRA